MFDTCLYRFVLKKNIYIAKCQKNKRKKCFWIIKNIKILFLIFLNTFIIFIKNFQVKLFKKKNTKFFLRSLKIPKFYFQIFEYLYNFREIF